MTHAQTLIDKAAELCGSRYKLAHLLHEDQGHLSKIAKGARPIAPGLAARMAAAVGLDPREAAFAAILEQEQDEAKRAELARIFGIDLKSVSPGPLHTNLYLYTQVWGAVRRLFSSDRRFLLT